MSKRFFRRAVVLLMAAVSSSTFASAQTFSIQANLVGAPYPYLEIQGNDGAYAELSDFGPGAGIGAYLNSYLLPQVQPLGRADIVMSYDQQATPSAFQSVTAYYDTATSPMSVTLSGTDSSQLLTSGTTRMSMSANPNGTSINLGIVSTNDWYAGPIPGNTFALHAPVLQEFSADLKTLLQESTYSTFENFSAMGSMPVRLTAPQIFGVNSIVIRASRSGAPAGTYNNIAPIDLTEIASFGLSYVGISFTAKFNVRVDASDYASEADFLAATAWIDGNVRQIDYDFLASYAIASVSPVPELSSALLILAGLALLGRVGPVRRRLQR